MAVIEAKAETGGCRGVCRCLHTCVDPTGVVCLLAIMLNSCLLYLLISKHENPPDAAAFTCIAGGPTPAAPEWYRPEPLSLPDWSTPEEQEHLNKSMTRWYFSGGMCAGCENYRYKRLINPSPSICSPMENGTYPKLLILVSTIHRHKENRDLIRETWGSHSHNNTGSARLLFLLGSDPGGNLTDERLLQEEGAAFGDILQDDFNSTYRRGGEIQLIMGYSWVVQHCPNVTHIVKVSEDVYLSVPQVLQLISTVDLENGIYGAPIWGGSPPFRDPKHRWYTSPATWPAPHYPAYVAGFFIGITMPVLRKILLINPYIAWSAGADDVIVGLAAEKMQVRMKPIGGCHSRYHNLHPCNYTGTTHAIHVHGHPPKVLSYMWARRDCFEGGKVHVGFKNDSAIYKG